VEVVDIKRRKRRGGERGVGGSEGCRLAVLVYLAYF
jgi:hypothetical protein